jgi:hypothetical protein
MCYMTKRLTRVATGLLCAGACGLILLQWQPVSAISNAETPVSFNKDIRPILADNCLACHGFDPSHRKADLRLDTFEGATAVRDGSRAIAPGEPQSSEMLRRVRSSDPSVMMPPPDSGKRLSRDQVATLERWVRQGARYERHWAFEAPSRPPLPQVSNKTWTKNEIDFFILARLEQEQLSVSPEASKETLIRRVTLDLTGLPPSLEEVDDFLADTTPDAYERVVDRLLASPRYGEHMAHYWLDVARYGDTHGLHLDNERGMWTYRDWVVKAFNENLPFDQFTVWQLAGDMLPEPTTDQLIASGFNRCNVSTSEGGAIDEEFHVRYAVDRVETTSTAWMGLTMGCAVCHDHKLDPITQKEFFQVFSIFNNMDEKAMDGNALLPPPVMKIATPEQQKQLDEISALEKTIRLRISNEVQAVAYTDPASLTNTAKPEPRTVVWVEDDFPADAEVKNDGEPATWVEAPGPVFSGQKALRKTGKGLNQVYFKRSAEPVIITPGAKVFANVYIKPDETPKAIMLQYHTKEWSNRANWGDADAIPYGAKDTTQKVQIGDLPETGKWVRLEVEAARLGLEPGVSINGLAFTAFDGAVYWDQAGFELSHDPALDPARSFSAWAKAEAQLGDKSTLSKQLKGFLKKDYAALAADQQQKLRTYYLENVWEEPGSAVAEARKELKAAQSRKEALDKVIPQTLISKELEKPRPAFVLIRGEYDKHGEPVGPGTPSILPPLPESESTNRLTFARWLVDGKHPLTGRVTVNRFWQQFFGTGIVKTSEDLGTKGDWPSHPELLDWLAVELPESGWDVKALVKRIVTSATYRQDSKVTPALAKADPENRLLARGARFRLDAEVLRDSALHAAGLLNFTMGGRGVRTYQPPGIWEAVGYTKSDTANYTQDKGDALYRRSLYIFLKRTAPSPLLTTFDGPSREQCRSRRERTNTPLQALLTLNDVQYFEAARHLGYRMLKGADDDSERLRHGFRLVTARQPTASELDTLTDVLVAQRARYKADPKAAHGTISTGDSPVQTDVATEDLAAYTLLANLMLNLDEALTRN